MSLSADERQKGIQPLTKDNYLVWIEMIKDHILALDCDDAEDIWEAFEWEVHECMHDTKSCCGFLVNVRTIVDRDSEDVQLCS